MSGELIENFFVLLALSQFSERCSSQHFELDAFDEVFIKSTIIPVITVFRASSHCGGHSESLSLKGRLNKLIWFLGFKLKKRGEAYNRRYHVLNVAVLIKTLSDCVFCTRKIRLQMKWIQLKHLSELSCCRSRGGQPDERFNWEWTTNGIRVNNLFQTENFG